MLSKMEFNFNQSLSSTLRVAPKGDKPSPRVVFRYGSQDHQIKGFLKYRRLVKRIYRRIGDLKRGDFQNVEPAI